LKEGGPPFPADRSRDNSDWMAGPKESGRFLFV
jgi:hypothetical protein